MTSILIFDDNRYSRPPERHWDSNVYNRDAELAAKLMQVFNSIINKQGHFLTKIQINRNLVLIFTH